MLTARDDSALWVATTLIIPFLYIGGALMRQSSLFKAGQDAPPTKKVSDMIQTSYAPLFKRNGISTEA